MGRAGQPRFAVVFLMILTIGLSLGLPAVDVLEAVYDESEALPCEAIPQFSVTLQPVDVRITRAPLRSLRHRDGAPFPSVPAPVCDTDTKQCAHSRVSLAMVCTLLC
jgi:hypothetical protein